MSLLMDALKKAEQTKQQSRVEPGEPNEDAGGLSLEPIALEPLPEKPQPPTGRSPLPDLPTRLETLDAQFLESIPPSAPPPQSQIAPKPNSERPEPPPTVTPPPRAKPQHQTPPPKIEPKPAQAEEKAAIQNVFASKQAPERSGKTFAIVVGATTLVAVAGIGVYFWLQLKPGAGTALVATAPRPAPVAAPSAPAPIAAPTPAPPAVTEPPTPAPPAAAQVEVTEPKPAPVATAKPTPKTRAAPIEEEGQIRISRSRLKPNPTLSQAYEAFEAGDLAQAQTAYQQVLKADPLNLDALHGLAAIAQRQGRPQQAEAHYQRILEADPRDAVAQSALLSLSGQADASGTESRLKSLVAAQPEQGSLHFALGNLQAASQRWNEAQQSFFKAYTTDPENPDYLFNLAVSLDHLRQPRLAVQYYNQALIALDKRPANFDKVQAAVRLRELQP